MNLKKGENAMDLMAMWRESGGALESLPAGAGELRSRRRQEIADEGLSASMRSLESMMCDEFVRDECLSASMGSRNYPWCIEPDEGLAASCFTHPAETCWSHPDHGPAASSYSVRSLQNCIGETDEGLAASCHTSPGNCPGYLSDEGLAASSRSGGQQYCFAPPLAD